MSPRVRPAGHQDVQAIGAAVSELLVELAGTSPETRAMESAALAVIDDPAAGAILVAEADGALVGVLAASWQMAIHVPGRYALIQDLWISPSWRGRGIGAGLLKALFDLVRHQKMTRVEVGLPWESFARFEATETFYLSNGFQANGPRMKRLV